jgi:hypothetical protein
VNVLVALTNNFTPLPHKPSEYSVEFVEMAVLQSESEYSTPVIVVELAVTEAYVESPLG